MSYITLALVDLRSQHPSVVCQQSVCNCYSGLCVCIYNYVILTEIKHLYDHTSNGGQQ